MAPNVCFTWISTCVTLSEWRDVSLMVGAYLAIPGVVFTAWKTLQEIRKFREERTRERQSRIHARQLDALGVLYEGLDKIQAYAQLMTKSAIFEGERPEEYPRLLQSGLVEARREFVAQRLLLPVDVVSQIETFIQKTTEGQINFYLAERATTTDDRPQRAQYWTKTAEIAHKELPELLKSIESTARKIIHGETT
jgi:hypothetical protein